MKSAFKNHFKKYISLFLSLTLILSLTGCEKKQEKRYQNYVKSLIAINYLGATEDYIKATGANKADADALYEANAEYLADSILAFYGIEISEAPDMYTKYVELAKNIYSKANYKVSKAYKSGTQYFVDVTIYPMNIFAQTSSDVIAYVDYFNQEVANGTYNNYTMNDYETEFSSGMLDILNEGCMNMTYGEPVTVTVTIITEDNTFYIGDHDFMAIDAAMISTATTVEGGIATDTDAGE